MLRLGYDIGGMNIKACLLDDANMRILEELVRPFPAGQGQDGLEWQLAEMGKEIAHSFGITPSTLKSVGIGIPGTVRRSKGVLLSACNLHLENMCLSERMRRHFPNARIEIANDADAAALAEYYAGAFQGYNSALLVTIGTGIGGGLIVNRQLFQGGLGVGCELGHITIQQGGPMCGCGNRGCAESLCSATWLEGQGRHCLIEHPTSRIATLAGGKLENVSAKNVLEAAQEGDGIARQIFEEYLCNLTSLLTTCCYLLGPQIIAIGGGVSNAGDFLIRPLEERVRIYARAYMAEKITTARLTNQAGMIGAAMLPEFT